MVALILAMLLQHRGSAGDPALHRLRQRLHQAQRKRLEAVLLLLLSGLGCSAGGEACAMRQASRLPSRGRYQHTCTLQQLQRLHRERLLERTSMHNFATATAHTFNILGFQRALSEQLCSFLPKRNRLIQRP